MAARSGKYGVGPSRVTTSVLSSVAFTPRSSIDAVALVDLGRVLDRVHGRRVLGLRGRVEDALPAPLEVVGVERSAVGPGQAVTKGEGELRHVVVGFHVLREAHLQRSISLIDEDETLEEVLQHLQATTAGRYSRVESVRLALGQPDDLIGRQVTLIAQVRGAKLICRRGAYGLLDGSQTGDAETYGCSLLEERTPGERLTNSRGCRRDYLVVAVRHTHFLSIDDD